MRVTLDAATAVGLLAHRVRLAVTETSSIGAADVAVLAVQVVLLAVVAVGAAAAWVAEHRSPAS